MVNPFLPAGFRFHPTDEELIVHYLKKKITSSTNSIVSIIADIDLYKFNPWELPGLLAYSLLINLFISFDFPCDMCT